MQREIVEERGWVSNDDYLQGLAFSQLIPGPLAAQLANYLGWVHSGIPGATLTGIAFVLPSFLGLGAGCGICAFRTARVDSGNVLWNRRGSERRNFPKRLEAGSKDSRRRLRTLDFVHDFGGDHTLDWIRDCLAVRSVWIDCDASQSSSKSFVSCFGFLGSPCPGTGCPCLDENSGDNLSFLPQGWSIRVR